MPGRSTPTSGRKAVADMQMRQLAHLHIGDCDKSLPETVPSGVIQCGSERAMSQANRDVSVRR